MRAVILSTVLVAFGIAGCGAEPSDASGDSAAAINAKQLRYKQVNITAGPANLDGWFPRGLSAQGEAIGQAFDCNEDFSVCRQFVVKRRDNGQFTVLAEDFFANDVNSRGDSGGCTTDPVNFEGQAGVVSVNGKLELIPPLPGERSSCVSSVSDSGVAFVTSTDQNFVASVYIFDHGKIRPFPVSECRRRRHQRQGAGGGNPVRRSQPRLPLRRAGADHDHPPTGPARSAIVGLRHQSAG